MGHGLKPLRIRLSLQRSERLGGGIAELDLMRGEAVQAISVAAVAARAEIALLPDLLLDGGALLLDLLLDMLSPLPFSLGAFPTAKGSLVPGTARPPVSPSSVSCASPNGACGTWRSLPLRRRAWFAAATGRDSHG